MASRAFRDMHKLLKDRQLMKFVKYHQKMPMEFFLIAGIVPMYVDCALNICAFAFERSMTAKSQNSTMWQYVTFRYDELRQDLLNLIPGLSQKEWESMQEVMICLAEGKAHKHFHTVHAFGMDEQAIKDFVQSLEVLHTFR